MCNGFSTRTSKGGTIAVLRPPFPDSSMSSSSNGMHLFFKNAEHSSAETGTQAAFETTQAHEIQALKGCWVVVQYASPSPSPLSSGYELPANTPPAKTATSPQLPVPALPGAAALPASPPARPPHPPSNHHRCTRSRSIPRCSSRPRTPTPP
jgi:hypothetical protein